MRKSVSEKQTALPIDLEQRRPVVHEHVADFTAMGLGTCAGNGRVVVRCPLCERPSCVELLHSGDRRFVHWARIQNASGKLSYASIKHCDVLLPEYLKRIEQGQIVVTREGSIMEVRSGGYQLATNETQIGTHDAA